MQAVRLITIFLLVQCACLSHAQPDTRTQEQKAEAQSQKHSLEELADEANKHSFQDILNRDPEAVRNIEEIFAATSNNALKARIASILMRIGVRDQIYFDFLTKAAEQILESDMPWAENFDKETGEITGVNPAFVIWCKKHHRDEYEAFEEARYQTPILWLYLASTGDARAYELLIKGLHAENKIVVIYAALGLAKLQDDRAAGRMPSQVGFSATMRKINSRNSSLIRFLPNAFRW